MADVIKRATAGTMESSDAYVEISPSESGKLEITLDSVVMQQFGESIMQVVEEVLTSCGVKAAKVNVIDKGALDCVIRARVETAVMRGKGE